MLGSSDYSVSPKGYCWDEINASDSESNVHMPKRARPEKETLKKNASETSKTSLVWFGPGYQGGEDPGRERKKKKREERFLKVP